MDHAKLARLQAAVKIGGKGTPRRKVIKKSATSSQADDAKLHAALKKLQVASIGNVEELNMFQEDGKVLHFQAPHVHATGSSESSGLHVVYGAGKTKEITELLPSILSQLGPDSLRKLADSYQEIMKARQAQEGVEGEKEDEGVPQLESFEVDEEAKEDGSKLDELN